MKSKTNSIQVYQKNKKNERKWRGQDSNLRPSGYEPDELPTAPPRDLDAKI